MSAVGRRVVRLAVVLLLVTIFTALLTSLIPGDPTVALGAASEEQQAQLREDLGLGDPLPVRYVDWLGDFVSGDFGNYYGQSTSTRPVYDAIRAALPVSLQLMVYAQLIALAVAIPLGVLTAHRAGTRLDKGVNTTAFALLAVPNFVLALLLSYYVGTKYGWLPPLGYTEFSEDPVDHIRRMILPAISLAAGQIAIYLRLLRSDMIATLQEGYIDTARAKGLPNRRILWRHAMRPSSLTLLTVAGLNVGALIGGALIIEVIFSLPGMGQLISEAIARRQYVALQSAVAVVAIGYVIVNLFVDVLYGVLDPRGSAMAEVFAPMAPAVEQKPTARVGIAGWIAAGWLVVVVLAAVLAPVLPLKDPNATTGPPRSGPSAEHPLGTDTNGRDLLSRVVWGARAYSLLVGVAAVVFGLVIGGALGLTAGYYRGPLDGVVTTVLDVLLAIPPLVLALALVAVLATGSVEDPATPGRRLGVLILALGIVSVPVLGRITRANALTWSEREFVTAARAMGASPVRVMVREVLPNVLPAMFSIALLGVAVAIVAEGGLSILGVGVQLPMPSWGNIIAEGKDTLTLGAPYAVAAGSTAIFLTVLALNHLGDVVRARFDVRESVL